MVWREGLSLEGVVWESSKIKLGPAVKAGLLCFSSITIFHRGDAPSGRVALDKSSFIDNVGIEGTIIEVAAIVEARMIELSNGVGIGRQPGLKPWEGVKQNSLAGEQDQ